LTFAATAKIDPTGNSALQTGSQWTLITFWDALNVIGIDAFVPLTNGGADPTPSELESAWKGEYIPGATPTNAVGNIFKKMRDMSDHYNRRILFTGAGYESLTGATAAPGSYPGTQIDPAEQQNDMEGLLQTFSNEPWWLGVIWSYDYPVWPRNSLADTSSSTGYPGLAEANYDTNTEWAGKQAGKYLGQTYQNAPLPETLWEALTQQ